MTLFTLIRKNLTRKKLRFILTEFAIVIAFFLFGLLLAFNRGLSVGQDLSAADRLVVNNRINFTQKLPLAYVERIAAVENVQTVTHSTWFGGFYQEPRNWLAMFAVEPDKYFSLFDELRTDPDEFANWQRNRVGIMVGQVVADRYGFEVGQRLPINSNIYTSSDGGRAWNFVVEGIFYDFDAPQNANSVLMHYDYLNKGGEGSNTVGQIVLRTTDPAANDQVSNDIDAEFLNSPDATETITEAAFAASFVAQSGSIGLVIQSVAGAAVFIILIIVGNTMVQAIRERTKEIGVLKALGFQAGTIVFSVIVEALMLSFIGGLLGLGLASLSVFLILATGFPFPIVLDVEVALFSLALMLLLGLSTALIPAIAAHRQSIAAAFSRG